MVWYDMILLKLYSYEYSSTAVLFFVPRSILRTTHLAKSNTQAPEMESCAMTFSCFLLSDLETRNSKQAKYKVDARWWWYIFGFSCSCLVMNDMRWVMCIAHNACILCVAFTQARAEKNGDIMAGRKGRGNGEPNESDYLLLAVTGLKRNMYYSMRWKV